jgi:FkbM family methyltransferase
MRSLFKKQGLHLQNFYSLNKDRFFIYQVNDHFIPNELLVDKISYEAQFEKCRNESLFAYMPRKGDCIIDIGAGLGEETIYYSHLAGENGNVLAIEANPDVFEVLNNTIRLNKLPNVTSYNIAIYDQNTKINLAEDKGSYEAFYVTEEKNNVVKNIPATRLGDFLRDQKIKRIDLLKVNIEGGERFITDTLGPEHLRMVRHVAIACHDFRYRREGNDFFKTKELVIQFLQQNGFEIQTRSTDTEYLNDWVYGTNKFSLI